MESRAALGQFLEEGLARMKFKYTAKEKPCVDPKVFSILDDIEEWCANLYGFSSILDKIEEKYFEEDSFLIYYICRDLIRLLDIPMTGSMKDEYAYCGRYYFLYHGSELSRPCIIFNISLQRTFMTRKGVLDDMSKVLFDVRNFYGKRDVFCVTTNLNEWQLHWLQSSQECAEAISIVDRRTEHVPFPTAEDYSPLMKMSVIDPDRYYVVLNKDSVQRQAYKTALSVFGVREWEPREIAPDIWSKFRPHVIDTNALSLHMTKNVYYSERFVAVKYYQHYPFHMPCSVWLAIASGTRSLVLIKEYKNVEESISERSLWVKANRATNAFTTFLGGKPVLVMPFTVTAITLELNRTGELRRSCHGNRVEFDFDLKMWITQDYATASGDQPLTTLVAQNAAMKRAALEWMDPRKAAAWAIQKLAAQCVVHEDMKWRHFALMPVFSDEGQVMSMEPVMIDFGRIRRVKTVQEALDEMIGRLQWLMKYYDWSEYDVV